MHKGEELVPVEEEPIEVDVVEDGIEALIGRHAVEQEVKGVSHHLAPHAGGIAFVEEVVELAQNLQSAEQIGGEEVEEVDEEEEEEEDVDEAEGGDVVGKAFH